MRLQKLFAGIGSRRLGLAVSCCGGATAAASFVQVAHTQAAKKESMATWFHKPWTSFQTSILLPDQARIDEQNSFPEQKNVNSLLLIEVASAPSAFC